MRLVDVTLNIMSLGGLALGEGIRPTRMDNLIAKQAVETAASTGGCGFAAALCDPDDRARGAGDRGGRLASACGFA